MKRVFKYPLVIDDVVEVIMPKGAKVLTVQMQHNVPCIWAVVESEETELESRFFRIAGTGHGIVDEIVDNYIDTFQMRDGMLVFHLFEIKKS